MIRLLVAAVLVLAAPAAAQNDPPPATVVVAFDRETITPLIVEGLANRETGRALDANDPVRIASISKLIMALAALRLADEGKLDLDRDVSDYLGWKLRSPHHPNAPVTLAHLMSHRAGLSDRTGYIVPLGESLEARLSDPAAWRDTGPPGEAGFQYANLGSPVVATALEAASGERYDRLVERLVFAPLGVKACFNWIGCGPDMEARAVTLYRDTGEIAKDGPAELPPACTIPAAEGVACDLDSYVPGTNASIFSPQGGVRIGMIDLAKIGRAVMDETGFVKSPEARRAFFRAAFEDGVSAPTFRQQPNQQFFCVYALHFQYIDVPGSPCDDALFGDGTIRTGHSGEAYGLISGLWIGAGDAPGFAFFTTENPPPPGGEDTGGFTARERALMARALDLAEKP